MAKYSLNPTPPPTPNGQLRRAIHLCRLMTYDDFASLHAFMNQNDSPRAAWDRMRSALLYDGVTPLSFKLRSLETIADAINPTDEFVAQLLNAAQPIMKAALVGDVSAAELPTIVNSLNELITGENMIAWVKRNNAVFKAIGALFLPAQLPIWIPPPLDGLFQFMLGYEALLNRIKESEAGKAIDYLPTDETLTIRDTVGVMYDDGVIETVDDD